MKKKYLNLKELMKRPKSFFKFVNGVGMGYDRFTNTYSFDYETCGFGN